MKKPLFELLVVCSTTHKPISIITLTALDFSETIPKMYHNELKNKLAYNKLIALHPELRGKVYIYSNCNTAGAAYGA